MREILFRGKTYHGTWVYGDLVRHSTGDSCTSYYIHDSYETLYEVIPETVGQYAGLMADNGQKIFEGDICNMIWCRTVMIFDESEMSFIGKPIKALKPDNTLVKVVGNIWDTPELLEKPDGALIHAEQYAP